MADCEANRAVYLAISKIPVAFRSANLRNYFSQFIESGGFQCFHYRHRPEVLRESAGPEQAVCGDGEEGSSKSSEPDASTKNGSESKQAVRSCCCIVSVHAKDADRFIKMYAGNHWIDSKGNWLARRCVIRRIKVSQDKGKVSRCICGIIRGLSTILQMNGSVSPHGNNMTTCGCTGFLIMPYTMC